MKPDAQAGLTPEKPAVVDAHTGAALSFGDLVMRSKRLAGLFSAGGLSFGDNVLAVAADCRTAFEVAWAAQRSGLHFSLFTPSIDRARLAEILPSIGVKVVVTSEADVHQLAAGQNIASYLVRDMIPGGTDDYETAIRSSREIESETEREGAFLAFSSGSTGAPKAIRKVIPEMPFGHWASYDPRFRFPPPIGPAAETISLLFGTIEASALLNRAMIMLRAGGTVVLQSAFNPAEAVDVIARHGITNVYLRPNQLAELTQFVSAGGRSEDLSTLKYVVHSGGVCPRAVKEKALETLGLIVHEQYASAEGAGHTYIGPEEWIHHKGSVGLARHGGFEVRGADGVPLPAGEEGEIFGRPPLPFTYSSDGTEAGIPAETRADPVSVGDVGYIDEGGYLFILDRKNNAFQSAAGAIYPAEIEQILMQVPGVKDTVVTVRGTAAEPEIRAYIVPGEAEDPAALEAEVRQACRAALGEYKQPHKVNFMSELPRSPSGKLLKADLDQLMAQGSL